MFDLSKSFGNASLALLVSAALHIVVIFVSLGGYVVSMIVGASLWTFCALLLARENRWFAGLVFFLVIFVAVTFPFASALTETGLTALAFWGIVVADIVVAAALFLALWRSKPVTTIDT